jgi:phosphodiesterase/alkaline phosphatase D-like protein
MSGRVALLCSLLLAVPTLGRADEARCTKALGRVVRNYEKTRQKTIARCENRRANGTLGATGVCRPQCSSAATNVGAPCNSDGDCTCSGSCPAGVCLAVSDASTGSRLSKAATKASRKVGNACDAVPPVGPGCNSAATPAALGTCLTAPLQDPDLEQGNSDTLMRMVYGEPAPADPTLLACQTAVSDSVKAYVSTRIKALVKCQAAVASGRIPGPCPDAATASTLDNAASSLNAGIRKRCTDDLLLPSDPMAPSLSFGFPCESYLVLDFLRGMTGNNSRPPLDRLIRCLTNQAAAVADHQVSLAYPAPEPSGFTDGVAAGDATDTAAIFWTKLPDSTMSAFLDVSTDSTFPVAGTNTITVMSPSGAGGVVKEEVGMLNAKTDYFYRFRQGTDTSAVGRVTTAPSPSDTTRIVRITWSGDSNAFYRPYTSLDPLRLLQSDVFFYIGDTIYGDDPLADGVDAMTEPEYEAKYRENRSDAGLRHLMESTGTDVMWDDHEVRNDFAGAEPVFATRMAAGNQAFRRYMPLREDGVDAMRLYRSFRWGSSAEFFMIDLRQYRSAKYTCCNAGQGTSGFVTTDDDSTCTGSTLGEALVPSASCQTQMNLPSRTILGSAQKAWLENGLLNSTATFKFIMNGPPITELLFDPYDRWEAYTSERNEILDYITTNNIKNVIWLSTDLHAVVISPNRLEPALTSTHTTPEVVEGPIGEQTLFRELPASVLTLLNAGAVQAVLAQVSEFDIDHYNGVLMTVDPTAVPPVATLDFYDRAGAKVHTLTFTATP